VVTSLLRSTATVAVLVTLYATAPLDRPLDLGTWLTFCGGLLVFALILTWQVRVILRSRTPRLQAAQTIAVGLPTLLLLFAAGYVLIGVDSPESFTEPLDRTDALYFTVTVFTTVGFGDIAPRGDLARIVTTVQMLVGVTVVGVIAKVLLGAVQAAERRRDDEPERPGSRDG
jgi:voltage-gated potassium channel